MTLLVYGALGAVMFILVLQLQVSAGWSALASGLSALPLTIILFALSSRAGALAARIGPRVPMSVGPALCAVGVLLQQLGAFAPGQEARIVLHGDHQIEHLARRIPQQDRLAHVLHRMQPL